MTSANAVLTCSLLLLVSLAAVSAHTPTPVTHSFDSGVVMPGPRLNLAITDASTGHLVAGRFSIVVDGHEYRPDWIDEHGIRFTSIHRTKKQEFTALYTRGTGKVSVGLPPAARLVEVVASRGFEYLPTAASGRVEAGQVSLSIAMSRWIDLRAQGWIGVDEHLHYDRLDPAADGTWLTMLDADGLAAGHFMVLKGGMMPGIWARQFAYGPKGQAADELRLIVPGQEYRDSLQGHINLLGVGEVIEPISTGGMGTPATPENFPPLHDVLISARESGAFTGAAHAGTLGRSPTAVADAVLGAMDFWELSNGFIHSTESWYRLMNCGYFLPPAAGTDLPNLPFRDPWQPMLGSVRTYVQTGGRSDFATFKAAMGAGRVFITGGPVIQITVDGKEQGDTIELPREGGTVTIRAEVSSPRPLHRLDLIRDGRRVDAIARQTAEGSIHRWEVEHRLAFTESGWIAAAAAGARIESQGFDAMAHTGAVRVLVDKRPVRRKDDLAHFIELLTRQREYYLKEGRYRSEGDRVYAAQLFERAMDHLRERIEEAGPARK